MRSVEASPGTPARVTCLLVDDLEENLLALAALLQGPQVDVLTARSGPDALELLLVHDVALAILDVQMPDMDGFELAELMRGSERTRHIPIIFVTAGAQDQKRLFKGYESGAVDFLYKPIEPHILRNKAQVFFQLHRQRRQLERELEERSETLRMNEMFTAVLGHDLRTPLGVILNSAELLRRLSADEAVLKAAARMLTSARRMSRMIDAVLDLARARLAGGIPLQREDTDLGVLVERSIQEHRTAHPQQRFDLVLEGDLTGHWDADRLSQVASNLISNSIQHGESNQPVRVHVDGRAADAVRLAIANAGAIPADVLPRIFDPFRRGERERRDGLGLGLYIVQQIVHAHQGAVDIHVEEENRTVFVVTIPRRIIEVIEL